MTIALQQPPAKIRRRAPALRAAAGSVHWSSASENWATPQDFFDRCAAEFGPFDLDACASPDNAKCARYFTIADNGLAQEWRGRVWMNPPYGRMIALWMRKAWESAQAGAIVVCLVPARTDTAWWHDYAAKGTVRFIRGRLKFAGHHKDAPFPSAIVIFDSQNTQGVARAAQKTP
jgi:phage N-6-adenine-methyltransferase